MALYPATGDWAEARAAAGMQTTDRQDMHAGELETSILLFAAPDLVSASYSQADHTADSRDGLLTLGMQGYTETGVIGRPSLATATKGATAIDSLTKSFQGCLELIYPKT